jgi:hypothetical protein
MSVGRAQIQGAVGGGGRGAGVGCPEPLIFYVCK